MILSQGTLTGKRVKPLLIDPAFSVDIDTVADFELVEQVIDERRLELNCPVDQGASTRPWPESIDLVVFDFDGVFTDNKVYVADDGRETVRCDRGDGMGVSLLLKHGVRALVLSTEANPVVSARCRKLNLVCHQGIADKGRALREIASESKVDLRRTLYVGNDANDLDCLSMVGFAVARCGCSSLDTKESCRFGSLPAGSGNGVCARRVKCDLIISGTKRKNCQ